MLRWCAVVVVLLSTEFAFAQSTVMPLPALVVKDADGKVMAQVADIGVWHESATFTPQKYPVVVLNVDGVFAVLQFHKRSLRDFPDQKLCFSNANCTGDAYMAPLDAGGGWIGLEDLSRVNFDVLGPDPVDGTFKMYRSTTHVAQEVAVLSCWNGAQPLCGSGGTFTLIPAEEVIPNPLAGFHGPTDAEPERYLTIAGGDVIRQPLAANGTACTVPGECASGFCVDDYCCDTSCDGVCESCSTAFTAGPDGTCSPIFAGIDPDNECGINCCDGAGACDSSGGC